MGLVSMATAAAVPMAKRASGERLVFAHYMLVTPPVNLLVTQMIYPNAKRANVARLHSTRQ